MATQDRVPTLAVFPEQKRRWSSFSKQRVRKNLAIRRTRTLNEQDVDFQPDTCGSVNPQTADKHTQRTSQEPLTNVLYSIPEQTINGYVGQRSVGQNCFEGTEKESGPVGLSCIPSRRSAMYEETPSQRHGTESMYIGNDVQVPIRKVSRHRSEEITGHIRKFSDRHAQSDVESQNRNHPVNRAWSDQREARSNPYPSKFYRQDAIDNDARRQKSSSRNSSETELSSMNDFYKSNAAMYGRNDSDRYNKGSRSRSRAEDGDMDGSIQENALNGNEMGNSFTEHQKRKISSHRHDKHKPNSRDVSAEHDFKRKNQHTTPKRERMFGQESEFDDVFVDGQPARKTSHNANHRRHQKMSDSANDVETRKSKGHKRGSTGSAHSTSRKSSQSSIGSNGRKNSSEENKISSVNGSPSKRHKYWDGQFSNPTSFDSNTELLSSKWDKKRWSLMCLVIIVIIILLGVIAALIVVFVLPSDVFPSDGYGMVRAHVKLKIMNRDFASPMKNNQSGLFKSISVPFCEEVSVRFLTSPVSPDFYGCKTNILSKGSVKIYFVMPFEETPLSSNITFLNVTLTGRPINDFSKRIVPFGELTIDVSTIEIHIEKYKVSSLPSKPQFPDSMRPGHHEKGLSTSPSISTNQQSAGSAITQSPSVPVTIQTSTESQHVVNNVSVFLSHEETFTTSRDKTIPGNVKNIAKANSNAGDNSDTTTTSSNTSVLGRTNLTTTDTSQSDVTGQTPNRDGTISKSTEPTTGLNAVVTTTSAEKVSSHVTKSNSRDNGNQTDSVSNNSADTKDTDSAGELNLNTKSPTTIQEEVEQNGQTKVINYKTTTTKPEQSSGDFQESGPDSNLEVFEGTSQTAISISDADVYLGDEPAVIECNISTAARAERITLHHIRAGNSPLQILNLTADDLQSTKQRRIASNMALYIRQLDTRIVVGLNFTHVLCMDTGEYICSASFPDKYSVRGFLKGKSLPGKPQLVLPIALVEGRETTEPITCTADVGFPAGRLEYQIKPKGVKEFIGLGEQMTSRSGQCYNFVTSSIFYTPTSDGNGTLLRCVVINENVPSLQDLTAVVEIKILPENLCMGKETNQTIRHPFECSKYIHCQGNTFSVSRCPRELCFDEESGQCGQTALTMNSVVPFLNERVTSLMCRLVHLGSWRELRISKLHSSGLKERIVTATSDGRKPTIHDATDMKGRFYPTLEITGTYEVELTLWVYDLICADEGKYECEVDGQIQVQPTQGTIQVRVRPEAPKISIPSSVIENSVVIHPFKCQANVGYPHGNLVWQMKMKNETEFHPVVFKETRTADIKNCSRYITSSFKFTPSLSHNDMELRCEVENSGILPHGQKLVEIETIHVIPSNFCLASSGKAPQVHPYDCHLFVLCAAAVPYVQDCSSTLCYNPETNQCDIQMSSEKDKADPNHPCQPDRTGVYFPHPFLCNKYIWCVQGKEIIHHCPLGTLYRDDGQCTFETDRISRCYKSG